MRTTLWPDSRPEEIDEWWKETDKGRTVFVGAAVYVADRGDGRLAGFIEVGVRDYAEGCTTTPVAYLEGWYVDADFRRAGLGRKLVHAAESWARGEGLREVASDAQIDNATSIAAHLALGYQEVERQVCFKKSLE